MGSVWAPTVKAIKAENLQRLRDAEKSLASLKNQDGWYADDHRRVIALRRELAAVIERHTADTSEGDMMTISLTDPAVILAGIKQFGLAPDGSDLRDLSAAFDRLCAGIERSESGDDA